MKTVGHIWVLPGKFRALDDGMLFKCYLWFVYSMLCVTKLPRPLVKRWRAMGLRCVMYIDDGINAVSSEHKCGSDTAVIVSDLQRAGFVLNFTKSILQPEQVGIFP